MAAGNKNLNSAKTARKDEFYTQLTDIEKEVREQFLQVLCPEFQPAWAEEADCDLLHGVADCQ